MAARARGRKKAAAAASLEPEVVDEPMLAQFQACLVNLNIGHHELCADELAKLHETLARLHSTIRAVFPPVSSETPDDACVVCGHVFTGEDDPVGAVMACGHRTLCVLDWHCWLRERIESSSLFPWMTCPADLCQSFVAPGVFAATHVPAELLMRMLVEIVKRRLARQADWVPCAGDDCASGFLLTPDEQERVATCEVCAHAQTAVRPVRAGDDDGLQALIADGTMRLCPVCEYPAMKEYGICNVLQCFSCQVWWNWRTRVTGATQDELKAQARDTCTLWEPGELAFQMDLQRRDKKAFIALLERNGQKYDPNYRRGGH